MPLPVASQAYLPNPLTNIQASQAGLEQGQQTILGGIQAAQGTANVRSTLQELQLAPQRLQIQKDQLAINQQNQQLEGQKFDYSKTIHQDEVTAGQATEARLQRGQDFTQGAAFDLEKEKFKLDQRKASFDEEYKRADLGIKRGEQSEKEIFGRAGIEYALNGNYPALQGAIGDPNTPQGSRAQSKFLDSLKGKDDLAKKIGERLQDTIDNATDPYVAKSAQRMLDSLAYSTKFQSTAEDAEAGAGFFRKEQSIHLDPGKVTKLVATDDSTQHMVYQENLEGKGTKFKNTNKTFDPVGIVDSSMDPKQKAAAFKAANGMNAAVKAHSDQVQQMQKSIADSQKQRDNLPGRQQAQTEAPAEENKARIMRGEGPSAAQKTGKPVDATKAGKETTAAAAALSNPAKDSVRGRIAKGRGLSNIPPVALPNRRTEESPKKAKPSSPGYLDKQAEGASTVVSGIVGLGKAMIGLE